MVLVTDEFKFVFMQYHVILHRPCNNIVKILLQQLNISFTGDLFGYSGVVGKESYFGVFYTGFHVIDKKDEKYGSQHRALGDSTNYLGQL